MARLIGNKTTTETVKMPIFAGMEYKNGKIINPKMRKVGYQIYKHTFDVNIYSDGHEDAMLIKSEKIKRVIK